MAKQWARGAQLQSAFVKMMVAGGALALLPMFAGLTPVLEGLAAVRPPGPLLLAAGAVLFWWTRRRAAAARAARLAKAAADAAATAVPQRPPVTWRRAVFEAIEWRRFEAVVEVVVRQAGFRTKSQSHGADGGVDPWLYSRHSASEQQRGLLAVALEGEYWRPTCTSCGVKMVERVAREGGRRFWGCPRYPYCKTKLQMRTAA